MCSIYLISFPGYVSNLQAREEGSSGDDQEEEEASGQTDNHGYITVSSSYLFLCIFKKRLKPSRLYQDY